MSALFNTILFQPIFNLFVSIYNIVPDVGFSILVVTILIKLMLYPLTNKSFKAQAQLAALQPKIDDIKEQYKGDQQKIAAETMKLYQESKVNPFGSCLPILIQLPIFIALYWVFQRGLTSDSFDVLYPFVTNPGSINTVSLGFLDLSKSNVILAVLAGAAQFWQAKLSIRKRPNKPVTKEKKDEDMMAMMNKQMLYVMPAMTVLIGLSFPGGLALYWFFSTLLSGLQQWWIYKQQHIPVSQVLEGEIVSKK